MIPKAQKLRRVNFPKHTDPKKVWIGSCLRIHTSVIGSDKLPRYAVVVSKKINPLSTKRNKIRRAIYDCTLPITRKLEGQSGVRIVITVQKKGNINPTEEMLKDDMGRFFEYISA